MFCRNCGAEVKETAKFCPKCGALQPREQYTQVSQPQPKPVNYYTPPEAASSIRKDNFSYLTEQRAIKPSKKPVSKAVVRGSLIASIVFLVAIAVLAMLYPFKVDMTVRYTTIENTPIGPINSYHNQRFWNRMGLFEQSGDTTSTSHSDIGAEVGDGYVVAVILFAVTFAASVVCDVIALVKKRTFFVFALPSGVSAIAMLTYFWIYFADKRSSIQLSNNIIAMNISVSFVGWVIVALCILLLGTSALAAVNLIRAKKQDA